MCSESSLLRAQDSHQDNVLVGPSDPRMLTLPPLDDEPCLLVRPNRACVGCDRLEMDSAEVAAYEPEPDELGDGCRPYAATPGVGYQADSGLGVASERVEVE